MCKEVINGYYSMELHTFIFHLFSGSNNPSVSSSLLILELKNTRSEQVAI